MGIVNAQGVEVVAARDSGDVSIIAGECYLDSMKFCKTFLSDNFYTDFVPELHYPIFKVSDEIKPKKQSVVCATRGIGKSTIARSKAAKAICYADKSFIVYLGKSSTHAEMQTENLKKDLMSKEIKDVWGSIKAKTPGDIDESWSKKSWVAMVGELCPCGYTVRGLCPQCGGVGNAHYTLVFPRGAGQQVRGILWKSPDGKNHRPDLIIVDDLEDSEFVDSEEWRNKTKEWFFSDVILSPSRIDKDWEIFYIDTLKHEDSLMAMLLDASDWDHEIVAICGEDYKSKAPDFMSDEEIEKMVTSYREKGMMDVFAREIMCMPISRADAEFKASMFRYYEESSKEFREALLRLANVLIIDPAKTSKHTSGETGLVIWGFDYRANMLYLRFASGERLRQDEMWDRAMQLIVEYKIWAVGIEDTGLGEFATAPLENILMKNGIHVPVEGLKARRGGRLKDASGFEAGKIQRIKALSGYYMKGLIKHNKVGIGPYELQLLGFPRSKRWDMIDAAAYIIPMMEHGSLHMLTERYLEETKEDVEKEFEEMEAELVEEEKRALVDWRYAP